MLSCQLTLLHKSIIKLLREVEFKCTRTLSHKIKDHLLRQNDKLIKFHEESGMHWGPIIYDRLFPIHFSPSVLTIALYVNITQLSNFTFTFRFHALEKAMAPHSSTLAWKIPWMEEPGRLQSMGSLGVRHDWATSLSLFTFMHWRRKWQPTPVFLPGKYQGWGWAAVYGVAQSWTRMKWLSSSSSTLMTWLPPKGSTF